jgi:hypothetical protein
MSDIVTKPAETGESAVSSEAEPIPNLTPFDIEPILLRPLYEAHLYIWKFSKGRPGSVKVGIWTALIMLTMISAMAIIDHSFLVVTLVAYHHLEAMDKISPMPIRQSFLIAGIIPLIAVLIGFAGQALQYLPQ